MRQCQQLGRQFSNLEPRGFWQTMATPFFAAREIKSRCVVERETMSTKSRSSLANTVSAEEYVLSAMPCALST
jgi:hypothetical protein